MALSPVPATTRPLFYFCLKFKISFFSCLFWGVWGPQLPFSNIFFHHKKRWCQNLLPAAFGRKEQAHWGSCQEEIQFTLFFSPSITNPFWNLGCFFGVNLCFDICCPVCVMPLLCVCLVLLTQQQLPDPNPSGCPPMHCPSSLPCSPASLEFVSRKITFSFAWAFESFIARVC